MGSISWPRLVIIGTDRPGAGFNLSPDSRMGPPKVDTTRKKRRRRRAEGSGDPRASPAQRPARPRVRPCRLAVGLMRNRSAETRPSRRASPRQSCWMPLAHRRDREPGGRHPLPPRGGVCRLATPSPGTRRAMTPSGWGRRVGARFMGAIFGAAGLASTLGMALGPLAGGSGPGGGSWSPRRHDRPGGATTAVIAGSALSDGRSALPWHDPAQGARMPRVTPGLVDTSRERRRLGDRPSGPHPLHCEDRPCPRPVAWPNTEPACDARNG